MSNLTYFYIRRWRESRSKEQNTNTGGRQIFRTARERADLYAASENAQRSSDCSQNSSTPDTQYRINTNR
jgi:hypothetical protein